MQPLPFEELIVPGTGRMKPRKVNVQGEAYACARQYMIRLEPRDFDDPQQLAHLAGTSGLPPDQFRQRFGYLCAKQA
jgi:hypothetical protein